MNENHPCGECPPPGGCDWFYKEEYEDSNGKGMRNRCGRPMEMVGGIIPVRIIARGQLAKEYLTDTMEYFFGGPL